MRCSIICFQIVPSVPRQNSRQQHRDNYQIADPKAYWRVSLYNVFVDHLVQEITDRVMKNEDRFSAQLLLPPRLNELQDKQVSAIFDTFTDDLDTTPDAFKGEVRRWRVRWSDPNVAKPSTLVDTLDKTSSVAYPGIYRALSVLVTIPATSVSCERSFSSMRRIKTYLRSTMTGDRLSSLGILNIHRDVDVDVEEIINRFASMKCRHVNFI